MRNTVISREIVNNVLDAGIIRSWRDRVFGRVLWSLMRSTVTMGALRQDHCQRINGGKWLRTGEKRYLKREERMFSCFISWSESSHGRPLTVRRLKTSFPDSRIQKGLFFFIVLIYVVKALPSSGLSAVLLYSYMRLCFIIIIVIKYMQKKQVRLSIVKKFLEIWFFSIWKKERMGFFSESPLKRKQGRIHGHKMRSRSYWQ